MENSSDNYINVIPYNDYTEIIQQFLNNIHNMDMNVQSLNPNEIQIFVEFEDIDPIPPPTTSNSVITEGFKTCKSINECMGKYEKISKEDLDRECSICIESFKEKEFKRCIPQCKHTFHKKCIDKWLKKKASCPMCRISIHK